MAITSIQRDQNNTISIVRMQVTDTLATVAMTDYILDNQEMINNLNGGTWAWFITDMILVAAEDGNAFYEFVDTTFATIVIFGQKGTGTVNPGLQNNLPYYAANGNTLSPLSNLANAILATNGSNVPGLTQTLPTAVQDNISTVGTIGTGIWEGTPVTAAYGGSGLSTLTAYAVLCGGTTATGNFQQVSGLGTTGYVLTSNGAGVLPTWQVSAGSGTVSPGTANDLAFYQTTSNTVSPLASATNGVLITSGLGVPSISSTLPSAVQGNITTVGTIDTGTWHGSLIGLAYGGSNANLTASNGGIVYSTASAMAILSGTATANQVLLSGSSTTPAWSTATYPATTTINQLLYSSANNVIGGVTAGNYGVLISSSSGVPSWLTNGTTGQVLTATTSGTPSWASPAASSVTFTGDSGTPFSGAAVTVTGGSTGLTFAASSPDLTLTGTLNMASGGTNASLTAAAGKVAYSTASALALSAAGSSGQIFQSAGTSAPGWTTATYPATAGTQYNVLQSTGTNITSATLTSVIDGALGSTQGDILYRNSSAWTVLAPGTSGQFLQTQGASANPQWAAGGAGTVSSGTGGYLTYYATTGTTVSALTTGTGVTTALGVNVGTAGAFVVNGGALGAPSSGNLANCTGYPAAPYSNYQISSSCGAYTTTSNTLTAVTNLSVTITTLGGPVLLKLQPDGSANGGWMIGPTGFNGQVSFFRGVTQLSYDYFINSAEASFLGAVCFVDTPAAGTYTYTLQVSVAGGTMDIYYAKLVALEL